MTQSEQVTQREPPKQDLLSDIRDRVWLPEGVTPQQALTDVMCTFSRRVTGGEAKHLLESLPGDAKPMLESCIVGREEPAERFDREELAHRVAAHLDITISQAEEIIAAVLGAVSMRLPKETVDHVANQLPEDLRVLWEIRKPPQDVMRLIVEDVERSTKLPPDQAKEAAVAVLCVLSERLTLGEATHFVESLPLGLRRACRRCLEKRADRPETFDSAHFFLRVKQRVPLEDAEPVVRAVFRAVQPYLSPDIIKHVAAQLPADLQVLWLNP